MEQKWKNQTEVIYSEVAKQIKENDVRDLWSQMQSELTRSGGGPDACLAYLDGEVARLKEQVERALDWLSEAGGGE